MNVFSFSRLSLYELCPFRFYQKYVLNLPEPVTKALALGKAVHKAIELRLHGMPEDEAVVTGWIETDCHPEVNRDEIAELVRNAPILKGEAEVHFELPLAYGTDLKLQGYIDLVAEDGFYDFKTNWRTYGPKDTMQLPLYAWAYMQLRGVREVTGTLYFLRYKTPMSHRFTYIEAEDARRWAYKLANEIDTKVSCVELFPDMVRSQFPAQPGSHCKHCPFAMECYARAAETG